MAHLVAIEPARHQHLYVLPEQVDVHAAGQNLIPVVPAELTHVATQLPLVLAKNGQTGQFVLAALTGFAAGNAAICAISARMVSPVRLIKDPSSVMPPLDNTLM